MMENEQQVQTIVNTKELPDHFEISVGSAAKGSNVTLKTYFDIADIDKAQQKIENTLKVRQYLMERGIIQ